MTLIWKALRTTHFFYWWKERKTRPLKLKFGELELLYLIGIIVPISLFIGGIHLIVEYPPSSIKWINTIVFCPFALLVFFIYAWIDEACLKLEKWLKAKDNGEESK